MKYLTDGQNLYELVSRTTYQNFGRTGGFLSYTLLRDVVSGSEARVDDLGLLALSVVR